MLLPTGKFCNNKGKVSLSLETYHGNIKGTER
jgi:hypothetical protein